MGYTIVYERRFLRCGDRYVPFCLFGSNNCTQINPLTGKEIREREWDLFSYGDQMLLLSAEELMAMVRKSHTGSRIENFKFRGRWVDDVQAIRFFENGIRGAVTVEDLTMCAKEPLRCGISAYVLDDDADKYPKDELYNHCHHEFLAERHIKTSADLEEWLREALEKKKTLQEAGKIRSAYLRVSLHTIKPLPASSRCQYEEPCVMRIVGCQGYVKSVKPGCTEFTPRWSEAMQLPSAAEAYKLAEVHWPGRALKITKVSTLQKTEDNPPRFVLSAIRGVWKERRYIQKKTRAGLYFTDRIAAAKRFRTASEASRWYSQAVKGRYRDVDNPVVEEVSPGD